MRTNTQKALQPGDPQYLYPGCTPGERPPEPKKWPRKLTRGEYAALRQCAADMAKASSDGIPEDSLMAALYARELVGLVGLENVTDYTTYKPRMNIPCAVKRLRKAIRSKSPRAIRKAVKDVTGVLFYAADLLGVDPNSDLAYGS